MKQSEYTKFLRSRGWRKYLGTWWYKQLPEWKDRPAPYQTLFNLLNAYKEEMKPRIFVEPERLESL